MNLYVLMTIFACLPFELSVAEPVDISGLNRVHLVQRLFRRARVVGHGVHQMITTDLPRIQAKTLVGVEIDYLHGKVMQIQVPAEGQSNVIETAAYDQTNGFSAAKGVVKALRVESWSNHGCATALAESESPEPEFGRLMALSNGTRAPSQIIRSISQNLFDMSESFVLLDHVAMSDLLSKCRNPEHLLNEVVAHTLIQRGLLRPDGTISTDIQNIVLSAVKGEAMDVYYQSPLFGAN